MTQTFVIDGIQYAVEPDIKGDIFIPRLGLTGWWVTPPRGFCGREFVILAGDRRIVTRNLWLIGPTDEPDNATFEGPHPTTVRIIQSAWESPRQKEENDASPLFRT